MSIIDGGSFKCYQHGTLFETTDPVKWESHVNDGKHKDSGSSVCAMCGNQTTFQHKRHGIKPICAKCREEMNKE